MAVAVYVCLTAGCGFSTQDLAAAVAHVDEQDHAINEQVWRG
jgi:hypothetical protein